MIKKRLELITDQRPFSIIYHDFFKCSFLDIYEKMTFIALKIFTDEKNCCFPSIKTLSKTMNISERKIKATLSQLEQKNIIMKKARTRQDGGQTSNLYTLFDFKELWTCDREETEEIINKFIENQMINTLSERGYTIKKKEESIFDNPSQAINIDSQKNTIHNQNTTQLLKSQERYTLEQVKQLFEYDIMLQDNSSLRKDIDSVIDILYNALNTTKPTIKIAGESKPTMVVIGKLMKLSKESIIYSINKFSEQTKRIKNPTAYMLTVLYNTPEQFNLDLQNQIQHNFTVVK